MRIYSIIFSNYCSSSTLHPVTQDEVITCSFSNSVEGVSTNAEHLLAAFPHSAPSQPGLGQVTVEVRSCDLALLLLGQIVLQSLDVFWFIVLLKKQMMASLRSNQMMTCCGSRAGEVFPGILNYSPTTSSAKHLNTTTESPPASWWKPCMQVPSVLLLCLTKTTSNLTSGLIRPDCTGLMSIVSWYKKFSSSSWANCTK